MKFFRSLSDKNNLYNKFLFWWLFIKKFGLVKVLKLAFQKNVAIDVPWIQTPLNIRRGESDIYIFWQIFISEEYNFQLNFNPKFIIDGGANVGVASIYFANRFQEAEIITVEPEESNFKALESNLNCYSKVRRLKAAIWYKICHLEIVNPGDNKASYQVKEQINKNEHTIESITIGEILRKYKRDIIDILKLDIEGAEHELFSFNFEEWLPKVRALVVEPHDSFKPGCIETIYKAVSKYDFTEAASGENLIFLNTSIDY